jgi:hypothetical protein
MTLRIVSDNTVELPVGNLQDIAGMAHRFADDVEAGDYAGITRSVTIVECDRGLVLLGWGENTNSYELMGLFEAAKLRVFADDFVDD